MLIIRVFNEFRQDLLHTGPADFYQCYSGTKSKRCIMSNVNRLIDADHFFTLIMGIILQANTTIVGAFVVIDFVRKLS